MIKKGDRVRVTVEGALIPLGGEGVVTSVRRHIGRAAAPQWFKVAPDPKLSFCKRVTLSTDQVEVLA